MREQNHVHLISEGSQKLVEKSDIIRKKLPTMKTLLKDC